MMMIVMMSLTLPPPQLIIFMALAKGTSRIRTGAVTLHTQTAIHVAEQLTQVRRREAKPEIRSQLETLQ